jgi:hypothetical protein
VTYFILEEERYDRKCETKCRKEFINKSLIAEFQIHRQLFWQQQITKDVGCFTFVSIQRAARLIKRYRTRWNIPVV